MIRSLALVATLALVGCGNKSSSTSACADAASKGVDQMIDAGKKKMAEAMASMPPEMKARLEERNKKLDEAATKLKQAITNRCTEDKWAADVVDCYGKAASREDLKTCRGKLPQDQQSKLQAEEMQVMMSTMGGPGAGGPGMGTGMGGPGMGMGPHGTPPGGMPPGGMPPGGMPPGGSGAPAAPGSGAPAAPAGGSAAPAAGSAAGSAK